MAQLGDFELLRHPATKQDLCDLFLHRWIAEGRLLRNVGGAGVISAQIETLKRIDRVEQLYLRPCIEARIVPIYPLLIRLERFVVIDDIMLTSAVDDHLDSVTVESKFRILSPRRLLRRKELVTKALLSSRVV